MNKNINTGVELTEKELACVCGGVPGCGELPDLKFLDQVQESMRRSGCSEDEITRFVVKWWKNWARTHGGSPG